MFSSKIIFISGWIKLEMQGRPIQINVPMVILQLIHEQTNGTIAPRAPFHIAISPFVTNYRKHYGPK